MKCTLSRFVLLDHMDWLSNYRYAELEKEWQAIVSRSRDKARVLFRSGGVKVEYVNPIQVSFQGHKRRLGYLLMYNSQLAEDLHQTDRVQTYAFLIENGITITIKRFFVTRLMV